MRYGYRMTANSDQCTDNEAIVAFWERARATDSTLPAQPPLAWAFGAKPEHADELLALVVSGIKTGTASSLWEYEDCGDPLPHTGELSVILDGSGRPRALIRTTSVHVLPFDQVSADHAYAEGEGDRTLEYWRAVHERYWRRYSDSPRGFEPDMPVVCERFQLLYPV